jgi:hypothetical protein
MNWKLVVGLLVALVMVLGIVKWINNFENKQKAKSSYIEETVGLKKSVKDITERRAKQIKEREQELDEE